MENRKRFAWFILVAVMAVAFGICIRNDTVPEKITSGTVFTPDGTWRLEAEKTKEKEIEDSECKQTLIYECVLPQNQKWILLMQSHWRYYQVYSDKTLVYERSGAMSGAMHLLELPQGQTLTICFYHVPAIAVRAIKKTSFELGDRAGMYGMILRSNLFTLFFTELMLILGIISFGAGVYMRHAWSKDTCSVLRSLGCFILLAGLWVVTDSRLLLLVVRRTAVVELVSFFSFFMLPLPLLVFAQKMMKGKKKIFDALRKIFFVMLAVYTVNYIVRLLPTDIIIVSEHVLMAFAIFQVLCAGFQEQKKRKDKRMLRVALGYLVFSIFSVLALLFFYQGNRLNYSTTYAIGILGFVFFLGSGACIAIYDQIRENVNIAMYAKMAYFDIMTGLENRAAFHKETEEDAVFSGSIGYIMIDANHLKATNDTLGHQKGDELLILIANCIKKAAGVEGCGYRIGGDEFVITLKNRTKQETEACLRRLQKELAAANERSELSVSAAVGYAWTDAEEKDLERLLQKADAAMYEHKAHQREQKKEEKSSVYGNTEQKQGCEKDVSM